VASAVTFAVALSTGCATGGFAPKSPGVVKAPPRSLKQVTVEERRAILKRAQVWTPIETQRLNLAAGPDGRGAVEENGTVTCRFVYPSAPLTGLTPKFHCKLPSGEEVTKWWVRELDPGRQVLRLTALYDVRAADGTVRRWVYPLDLRYYHRYELELLLARAGFQVESVFGSYAMDDLRADSARLLLIAGAAGAG